MFGAFRERAPGPRLGNEQLAELRRIRTQQPGYQGIVEVEAEDGRVLILTLWDTAEQAQAAGQVIEAAGRRLGGGQWSGPPPMVGQGQVIYNDLTKS